MKHFAPMRVYMSDGHVRRSAVFWLSRRARTTVQEDAISPYFRTVGNHIVLVMCKVPSPPMLEETTAEWPPHRTGGTMTTLSSTTLPRVVTHADLEADGFNPAQIKRLDELKANYPYLEFTDSMAEWRRLSFLKWRHSTGRLSD
jgi:hypothetical protein